MSPLLFVVRVAGVALLTAAGLAVVLEKLCPRPSDLVAGAIHFRKGMNEFQQGVTTILFGSTTPSAEETVRQREAARIPID
ncbi:MAG: hypothetical protein ACLP5H_29235 [Desulfomonilaceae bacterium]